MYSDTINGALESLSIKAGDSISYSREGLRIIGMLLPNSDAGDKNCLKIKLPSGYNVGVKMDGAKIEKIKSKEKKTTPQVIKGLSTPKNAKKIALITTGGTIAAKVDYKTGAVSAKINSSDFLAMYPGLEALANIEVYSAMNILSENMKPSDWAKIAQVAKEAIDDGAYGVVITHGTDTMGYTAAALAYALENLGVPIIITGSQRSPDRPSSDAHQNMKCSIYAALSDLSGVYVCMHSSTSDDFNYLHYATRTRKMHTSGRWAFKSIGASPVAKIYPDSKIEILDKKISHRKNSELVLKNKFSDKVHMAWAYPGISKSAVLNWSEFDGVVIAGTGFGHISSDVLDAVQELIESKTTIVMAPQCFEGRMMLQTYSTGRQLEDLGVIGNSCDWLAESAYVKLCWVLAQTKDSKKISELMTKPMCGDITEFSAVKTGE